MFRLSASLALLILASAVGTPACAQDPGAVLPRAFYWNVGDSGSPRSDEERIRRFRSLGAAEIHIWLNENRATPACGYRFRYQEGGALLWTPARLEAFTRALKAAGIKPVFILSPDLRTRSYIASLSARGAPLNLAAKIRGVDIELDIEGNGESRIRCPGDGLETNAADLELIAAIRRTTPTSKIIVSTIRAYDRRHPHLMRLADAISPQLYGAHFAYTLPETRAALNYFRSRYPKPLWVALSVECSMADFRAGRCSEALFDSEVKLVAEARRQAPGRVVKYVVWGEREAKRCPARPLCSVFAQDYLTRTAGR
jgi:hypothetical protein